MSTKNVTLPRTHYNAVRRVLRLLDGYLSGMEIALHAWDGGMKDTTELRWEAQSALKLMPTKRSKRKG